MDIAAILFLTLHLVGLAFGAGGAIATDATFLRTVWDRKISKDELNLIKILSKVVITGLVLLILSGFLLLSTNPNYLNMAENPVFWTKMTIVLILTANGFAFHKKVLPLLERHEDTSLSTETVRKNLGLLAFTGGLSGISWYSALALGVFMQSFDWSYLLLMNIYVLLVIGAVMSAYAMLYWILFRGTKVTDQNADGDANSETAPTATSTSESSSTGLLAKLKNPFIIATGAVLLIGVAGLGVNTLRSQPTEHLVCIHEGPPWFTPEVLEIDKGDTVVWHHCSEDEVEYVKNHGSSIGSSLFSKVSAHGDEDHKHVHTHPIYSISGPEHFSSDFATVGHLEDGLEFEFTFTEEGTYEYICPTHPYMKGIVSVGEEAPVDSLWPPDEKYDEADLLSAPDIPGIGEIWVNTQFEHIDGQDFPGSITVLDASTWEITDVISDNNFNNPHNLWNTYDNRYVFQTQWHSDKISKIDIDSKEIVESIALGNAPAHLFVHPTEDRIYVTLNNEDRVMVLDSDLNILNEIQTSFGPHGIWIDPGGRWMSVAATLEQKFDIIDLETEEVVKTFDAPGLPLATQITNDGRYAMISLLLEGKVRFIDLETLEHVKDVEVGAMPIWAMPGPNNEYVFVPNTGSADISVISLDTLEVVTTLPGAAGAHGITFGEREDGGYYGYVSNKYARVVTVIDVDNLETLGHIPLRDSSWGGNGILTLPNYYAEFID